ncbi:hypothetical protein TPA0907_26120 [Micromonospora humidisoli]|uniref:zf-HC2 domain-containing protein n=1 Tax=Micromonospora sp. AKA109 TaxID=2733865 RepID=UPI0022C8F600|nr:zf-HC2 domain-containing protein [Micromonospora sp. AKA109]GHJ08245.1 hypothetical protein TPA0907_26120 [Micromonospora sp. AKA109]
MRTGGDQPTAEHAALALYLLGALDDADRVTFEAHLAGCDECLSMAGEMGGVTSALGGLDAADWEDLAGLTPEFPLPPEFGPPPDRAPTPPAAPTPAALAPVPVARPPADSPPPPTVDDAGATADAPAAEPLTDVAPVATPRRGVRRGTGPRTTGGGAGSRPGGDRPATASGTAGTRPGDPARRRRMLLWGGVAAALVAVVLAGGIAAVTGFGDHSGVVLTATGEAPAEGVSLSVAITTDEGRGSTIRITATGLRQGLRYRLFAVTRDGVTHVVRDWTASTGPQEVTGELSLPVADLAFVTVGLVDGTAIVTAPISR